MLTCGSPISSCYGMLWGFDTGFLFLSCDGASLIFNFDHGYHILLVST